MTDHSSQRDRVARVVRFGAGSGVMLAFKLAVMWLLEGLLEPQVSYVIVHAMLLFVSYCWHARVTMGVVFSWSSFGRYTRAVALVKLADYLVFTVAFSFFHVQTLFSVVVATALIWVARYVLVTRALAKPQASSPPSGGDA